MADLFPSSDAGATSEAKADLPVDGPRNALGADGGRRGAPGDLHRVLDQGTIREVVVLALDHLKPHLPAVTLSEVEIVLTEVLNNIVEHAYRLQGRGPVDLSVSWDGPDALIRVCDRGREMPHGVLPGMVIHDLAGPTATLPEGGFGWGLIRALARDIDYGRHLGVNRLFLRVPGR